jgi:hypothetical protein
VEEILSVDEDCGDSPSMRRIVAASLRQGIVAAESGHMIPSQGAVPIIRNGVGDGARQRRHFPARRRLSVPACYALRRDDRRTR